MIRLKQTMGNAIKCKVDAEYMISRYECNVLSSHRLNGLFDFKADKGVGLVYSGETKKKLSDRIESGIDEKSLGIYIQQISQIIVDVQKIGLNPQKLVLNPEWIFFDKDEKALKLLYCPINGAAMQYEGVLFMRDLVLQANLNGDMRQRWNQWLDETAKTGITGRRISALSKLMEGFNGLSRIQSDLDDDGEALTGMEEEFIWENESLDDDGEEAVTGMDQTCAWDQTNSEDDEAPTGMDDDCIFSGNNLGDGTYSESTQEPLSLRGAGLKKNPQLVRKSTGEFKKIIGNEFKIGRSEQRADFCIKGNSGVSNVHAIVLAKGNKYYLKDNHSTNGTYVDGVLISDSSTPVPLQDGSIIRVYNEELEFHF